MLATLQAPLGVPARAVPGLRYRRNHAPGRAPDPDAALPPSSAMQKSACCSIGVAPEPRGLSDKAEAEQVERVQRVPRGEAAARPGPQS